MTLPIQQVQRLPVQQIQYLGIQQVQPRLERDEGMGVSKYLALLVGNLWLILSIALLVTLVGVAYVLLSDPIYQTNILIQVEDSSTSNTKGSPRNIQSELSNAFDIKTATASEMEILRSRTVLSRAVEHAHLYIEVRPQRFPLIGNWIARNSKTISDPGLFGYGGYVWGAEQSDIPMFNVPVELEGRPFHITVEDNQSYSLIMIRENIALQGKVGEVLKAQTSHGPLELMVRQLVAKPGAEFIVVRHAELETVEKLQKNLHVTERGKQSGIISLTLEGKNPKLTSSILNEIGREYVRLNVDRKSQKAQKSLAFLDKQLPELKERLESSEDKYKEFRNRYKTYDLGVESKAVLDQSVNIENRLTELGQKKIEYEIRFTEAHPVLKQVDQQISALKRQLAGLNERIRELPNIEQQAIQLSRDVKVNTELYTTLLGTAQQLRLATSSEVGNARLLDNAAVPVKPVKPKGPLVILLSCIAGIVLGIVAALARKIIRGRIVAPGEIEEVLGMPVSVTIPYSDSHAKLSGPLRSSSRTFSVLSEDGTIDGTLESLRRLRNSLQFAMHDSRNNVIMVTGPTQGVGKSFVSVNFAVVLASVGKKVLLIDADLRAGDLHCYFTKERVAGLSDVIVAESSPDTFIHRNVVENVDFLASGSLPPRPSELLAHAHFGKLLATYSEIYDYVLIDTPPLLVASDALSVAFHAGIILNVVRGGVSTMTEIEESVKYLNQAGYTVTSTIFNDSKSGTQRYSYATKKYAN